MTHTRVLLPAAPVLTALFWLWQQVYSHYDAAPFGLVGLVLVCGAFMLPRIPPALWVWWGLGLLTVFWSLTPGNTLALGLWEVCYLAAFGAGGWVAGLMGLNMALLVYGLFTTLALASAGLAMYFSGSAHYVSGAQGLLLVPVAAGWVFGSRWPLLSGLLLTGALYLALISGARAVYLPLVFIALLMVWRLWREGIPLRRITLVCLLIAAAIVSIDTALPFSPMQNALGLKATLSKQAQDLAVEGSIGSRLQMWAQTLGIALHHPFGTGNGSFRDTLAAYLQYPGLLFSSAHNYYLETAATGGWPRLVLLLAMLGWTLWHGWNSPAWPWALGAGGLWATLAFDVTGMYPAVMMLAFASLGAVHSQLQKAPAKPVVPACALALAIGLAAWWYWPCAKDCAIGRHLGYRPEVLAEAAQLTGEEQRALLDRAAQLNPKSLWVYRARLRYATTPEEQMVVLDQINQTFPFASPAYYLQQARLALQLNRKEEAIRVLQNGLERFPPGFRPADVPLGREIQKLYQDWRQAPALLEELRGTR